MSESVACESHVGCPTSQALIVSRRDVSTWSVGKECGQIHQIHLCTFHFSSDRSITHMNLLAQVKTTQSCSRAHWLSLLRKVVSPAGVA